MSRYIDADKLLDALYEHEFTILCPLDEVSNVIDEAPTTDVVEVVRCRDCKHYVLNTLGIKFCSESRGLTLPYDETFCSYGKRKVQ